MKKYDFKKYENILEQFEEFNKQNGNKKETNDDIKNIKNIINNQEFSIAIVANMSSGKSTFLNALFGDDILPAFSEATTDCPTYIYSDDDESNNKAIIYFEDDKKSQEIELNDVKKELKHYAKKDHADLDSKYTKVQRIELDWDFKNINTDTNSKVKVTFIDTPGPNNTGTFANKHKNKTVDLINTVDMVIFLFDYIQLDANLSSDSQGIWSKLEKRKKNDKHFGVYFVVNKIDAAIDDLIAHTKDLEKEERKEARKKNWNLEKNKAIAKIKQAAKKHGFEDENIYTVASSWALLDRKIKDEDEDDDLDDIKKKKFKRVWDDEYENEYYCFLGFNKLENDINKFIQTKINDKVFKKIYLTIQKTIKNNILKLLREQNLINQNELEIKENISKTEITICKEIVNLKNKFHETIKYNKNEFINDLNNITNNIFAKMCSDNAIKELTKKASVFLYAIAEGYDYEKALNTANIQIIKNLNLDNKLTIIKKDYIAEDDLYKLHNQFIDECIQNHINSFQNILLDDIAELFNSYNKSIENYYLTLEKELESEINLTLKINLPNVDIEGNIFFDNKILDNIATGGIILVALPFLTIGGILNLFADKNKIQIDENTYYEHIKNHLKSISFDEFKNNIKELYCQKFDYIYKNSEQYFNNMKKNKLIEIDDLNKKHQDLITDIKVNQDKLKKLDYILNDLQSK